MLSFVRTRKQPLQSSGRISTTWFEDHVSKADKNRQKTFWLPSFFLSDLKPAPWCELPLTARKLCSATLRGGPFEFWWGGGGGANPPKKVSSIWFWLKKYIYLAEFLRRKKISGSLNQGVAKDFAWCVTAPKVAVSHMIRDWASHFLMRDLVLCKRDVWSTN